MRSVLIDKLSSRDGIDGQKWMDEHKSRLKHKHIFYILKSKESCDRCVFKVGKALNGAARLQTHLNTWCKGFSLWYLRSFKRRAHYEQGDEPVQKFETNFKRNMRAAGAKLDRGTEFFQTSKQALMRALIATDRLLLIDQKPRRKSQQKHKAAKEWWRVGEPDIVLLP